MADLRAGAAVASTAVIMVLAPAAASAAPQTSFRLDTSSRVHSGLPDGFIRFRAAREDDAADVLNGVEGIDFGNLTDIDIAMMRRAATAGALEVDFSEFYLDDDE
ncbi:MAG: hypothetical protein ACJ72E_05395 [Marmoricola sp.]